jgi:environmental stress-induced protein Ves
MAEPVVLRAASRAVVPWRNGTGTTTVVAEGPTSAGTTEPLWRVSIATISRSAPFSEFVGVDRLLMPLSEAGLDLAVDGRRVRVERSSVLAFAGESEVEAVDVLFPGLDLNLMTRRGRAEGRLSTVRVPAVLEVAEHEVVVAIVVAGEVRVGDDALGELDALQVDGAASLTVAGRGLLAVAWMSVAPDAVAP